VAKLNRHRERQSQQWPKLAATKMTMTRFHVVAIAAGLLLAISGPSFAAKQLSDTKSAESQPRATKSSGSAIRPHSRDQDPYAPGVNWPKYD
jgi:hypothetical protein